MFVRKDSCTCRRRKSWRSHIEIEHITRKTHSSSNSNLFVEAETTRMNARANCPEPPRSSQDLLNVVQELHLWNHQTKRNCNCGTSSVFCTVMNDQHGSHAQTSTPALQLLNDTNTTMITAAQNSTRTSFQSWTPGSSQKKEKRTRWHGARDLRHNRGSLPEPCRAGTYLLQAALRRAAPGAVQRPTPWHVPTLERRVWWLLSPHLHDKAASPRWRCCCVCCFWLNFSCRIFLFVGCRCKPWTAAVTRSSSMFVRWLSEDPMSKMSSVNLKLDRLAFYVCSLNLIPCFFSNHLFTRGQHYAHWVPRVTAMFPLSTFVRILLCCMWCRFCRMCM